MDAYSSPVLTRVAQTLGISLSTLWGGATLSMSIFFVPALLQAPPPVAVKQWASIFNLGKVTGPPISIAAAGAYSYLAYQLPSSSSPKFKGYVTAAILSAVIAPYTIILMSSTNNKLLALDAAGGRGEGTFSLLDHWGVLNFWRGLIVTVSGGLGLWTALS